MLSPVFSQLKCDVKCNYEPSFNCLQKFIYHSFWTYGNEQVTEQLIIIKENILVFLSLTELSWRNVEWRSSRQTLVWHRQRTHYVTAHQADRDYMGSSRLTEKMCFFFLLLQLHWDHKITLMIFRAHKLQSPQTCDKYWKNKCSSVRQCTFFFCSCKSCKVFLKPWILLYAAQWQ